MGLQANPVVEFDKALDRLIGQVRPGMEPDQFISLVSQTFKRTQNALPRSDMEALLRRSKGHRMLLNTLASIRAQFDRPARILVLGCGATYAGIDGAYTEATVREVFDASHVEVLERADLTGEHLHAPSTGVYDLVLSHSVAHFIPNLSAFFRYVQAAVAQHGYFVLAREPNGRYWKNVEIQKEVSNLRPSGRKSRVVLSPRKLLAKLRASLRGQVPVQVHDAVNRVLQKEHAFSRPLSHTEIARLVDPHLPSEFGGEFAIGFEGLDWTVLGQRYLSGFREHAIDTWEHLGRAHEAAQTFPALEADLSRKYPRDGCFFSAVWQKI